MARELAEMPALQRAANHNLQPTQVKENKEVVAARKENSRNVQLAAPKRVSTAVVVPKPKNTFDQVFIPSSKPKQSTAKVAQPKSIDAARPPISTDSSMPSTKAVPGPSATVVPKKRVAFVDTPTLREDEDGKTKRLKLSSFESTALSAFSTCCSCRDEFPRGATVELACREDERSPPHAYCGDCIRRMFEVAIKDTAFFPPRCCSKAIPYFSCVSFLTEDLTSRFLEKRRELDTPNRVYCSRPTCAKWIDPTSITAGVGSCVACGDKTCYSCKRPQHSGLCPKDKDVKKLMDVARENKWKACPSCKEMIELGKGCYHITFERPEMPFFELLLI